MEQLIPPLYKLSFSKNVQLNLNKWIVCFDESWQEQMSAKKYCSTINDWHHLDAFWPWALPWLAAAAADRTRKRAAISVKDGLAVGLGAQHCSISLRHSWSQKLGMGGLNVLLTMPPALPHKTMRIHHILYVGYNPTFELIKRIQWKDPTYTYTYNYLSIATKFLRNHHHQAILKKMLQPNTAQKSRGW